MDSINTNSEDISSEDLFKKLEDLCLELNLDSAIRDQTWKSYQKISSSYLLEGNKVEWLICSIFVTCKNHKVYTLGKNIVEGNCISLIRLLKCVNMSILHFFDKMKKWCDMAHSPENICQWVEELQSRFDVNKVIFFSKYIPLFDHLFNTHALKEEAEDNSLSDESPIKFLKKRKGIYELQELFEFSWVLYIYVKGKYSGISGNLVHCFNLLLCCLDLVFINVLTDMRKDLINPTFPGVPEGYFSKETIKSPPEELSVITELCVAMGSPSLELDAKSLKIHEWNPFLRRVLSEKVIKGDAETLTGILQRENFDGNLKMLNKLYQEMVLNAGFFDERIFLGEEFLFRPLATPVKHVTSSNLNGKAREEDGSTGGARKNLLLQFEKPTYSDTLIQLTPLTGRRYLVDKYNGSTNLTPVSTASHELRRLRAITERFENFDRTLEHLDQMTEEAGAVPSVVRPSPPTALIDILRNCPKDTRQLVIERLELLKEKFLSAHQEETIVVDQGMSSDGLKFQLARTLYLNLLEKILILEKRSKSKNQPSFDFDGLLLHEDFNRSLVALSLEVVLFCHDVTNCGRYAFPCILNVLNLQPYVFYRVIELAVRAEDRLTRDMVKHLNKIEEQILERLAWCRDSPLWIALEKESVPWCREVFNSRNVEYVSCQTNQLIAPYFIDNPAPIGPIKEEQCILTPLSTDGDNPVEIREKGVQLISTETTGAECRVFTKTVIQNNLEDKPARMGSLALFFRKVYHVTSVRLRDLCRKLDIPSEGEALGGGGGLLHVIWTCFEWAVVHKPALLRDRHVDQLLMCSLYIMSKVVGQDRSFADIMRHYRTQPQAQNHVYRSVLLKTNFKPVPTGSQQLSSDSMGPTLAGTTTPTKTVSGPNGADDIMSQTTTLFQFDDREEERGDIIKFYNQVFVEEVKGFATKFANFAENMKRQIYPPNTPLLSPLPLLTPISQSPRKKISANHLVYVSPLKKTSGVQSRSRFNFGPSAFKNLTNQAFTYSINSSPSKDLERLNSMIRFNHKLMTVPTLPEIIQDDDLTAPESGVVGIKRTFESAVPTTELVESAINGSTFQSVTDCKKLKLEPILVPGSVSAKRGLHF